MLSVEQAQQLVLQHARRLPPTLVPVTSGSLGLILAEDVVSDIDMPPYDKSLMDGFAIRAEDAAAEDRLFTVTEEVAAGHVPEHSVGPKQAARIMTGAPIPSGADTVVMQERVEVIDSQRVRLLDENIRRGQNVLSRGREMRRGETVLSAGAVLRPQEVGILAAVGRKALPVYRQPLVAILSTGDEIVEPYVVPGPGQIRNSNATMLAAQVARAGATPRYLGIARDNLESLRPLVSEGLKADVFVTIGGVSAGKLDLTPEVLQERGVEPIFHKIAMKPGKPLFFGVRKQPAESLIFGLPGNPVSALVGLELFVRPALRIMMGHADAGPRMLTALLSVDYEHKTDRPTFHPARLDWTEEGWQATPAPWFGSSDLRGVTQSNAFVVLSPDRERYKRGEPVGVLAPEHF